MAEKEYKEKVKIDDDEAKVERESKDSFGNKVNKINLTQVSKYAAISVDDKQTQETHFLSF